MYITRYRYINKNRDFVENLFDFRNKWITSQALLEIQVQTILAQN